LTEIVLPIAQLEQIIMEKLVSPVLLHKNGTELNVLTDVIQEKFGTPVHKLVYVHQDNSGMDMLA
jgi:hypothetical protein